MNNNDILYDSIIYFLLFFILINKCFLYDDISKSYIINHPFKNNHYIYLHNKHFIFIPFIFYNINSLLE